MKFLIKEFEVLHEVLKLSHHNFKRSYDYLKWCFKDIDFKNKTGTIFHTRELNEEDILHELLHVRFNSWSEEKVNFWTELLMKTPKSLFQF